MPELSIIAGFDTETSGIDVYNDRIVTAYIATFNPDGSIIEDWSWIINPGIEIPQGAIDVHGVSNERAQAEGADPKTAIFEIVQRLDILDRAGVPISGMNLAYDLTLLREEVKRHLPGMRFTAPKIVLDAYVIDKKLFPWRKGKRNLTTIAPLYGVEASADAHNADADVMMATRVVLKQLQHEWLAPLSLEKIHTRQIKNAADQAASLEEYFHKKRTMPLDEHVDGGWPPKAERPETTNA